MAADDAATVAEPTLAGSPLEAAAFSLWSNAANANARRLSASSLRPLPLPLIMLGSPPSARAIADSFDASISSALKGVHTCNVMRML